MSRCLTTHHAHVVASGTCGACRQPVQVAEAFNVEHLPTWVAPPFDDSAAVCPATNARHTVRRGLGLCSRCGARVEVIGDAQEQSEVWWWT